eukprot:scaffold33761_cov49-Attheya_sp.AAC.1
MDAHKDKQFRFCTIFIMDHIEGSPEHWNLMCRYDLVLNSLFPLRLYCLLTYLLTTQLAALRLTKYWKQRIELFGDKAFAPLIVDDTLKDDISALELGFLTLLPGQDHGGRGLVYVEPCRLGDGGYDYTSMVRATWYMLHVALEEKSVQQKGVVFIVDNQNTDPKLHFDKKLIQMNAEAVRGILPVRVSGIHICHPSSLFGTLAPIMKFLLGPRLGKRINVHSGSEDAILDTLSSRYGIRPEAVPAALGGFTTVNQQLWLEDRREVESAVEATFVKTVEEGTTEDPTVEETSVEVKNDDEGTTEDATVEETTVEVKNADEGTTEDATVEETTVEVKNSDEGTTEDAAIEETTVEVESADEGTTEDAAVEETTVEVKNADEGTTDEPSVDEGTE